MRKPKVFLFDEPLSNLDARLRVDMRAELKRLHRALETTTIYVTHDQEEAMPLGDRIVVIDDGLVQQCGGPLEVYDQPANRFVAGFVGTPPMNFMDGRLVSADGGLYFDDREVRLRLPDDRAEALRGRAGQDAVMGVRPEAMGLQAEGRFAGTGNVLRVEAIVVEPPGEKMDVCAATERHPHLVARVDAQRGIAVGSRIELHLDMRKVHVFEPGERGGNLAAPGES